LNRNPLFIYVYTEDSGFLPQPAAINISESEHKGLGTHLSLEPESGVRGMSPTKSFTACKTPTFEDEVLQVVSVIKTP